MLKYDALALAPGQRAVPTHLPGTTLTRALGLVAALGAPVWHTLVELAGWLALVGRLVRTGIDLAAGRYGSGALSHLHRVGMLQVFFAGVQSLPLILGAGLVIAGAFLGLGYRTLVDFGGEEHFGELMRLGLLNEIGPLLTALIVIARSGTAITAELGRMRFQNEIDALTVHGVDPVAYLGVPRVVGAAIANVALTVFLCGTVYLGSIILVPLVHSVARSAFAHHVVTTIRSVDIARCLVKGVAFGIAIPCIAVYEGLNLPRDPNELPRAGSRAAVGAMIAVFVLDALITGISHD